MSHREELRMTDPVTGAQKGSKPERYDLIPADAMDEVARVYGEGAKKYGKKGECNCKSRAEIAVPQELKSTALNAAEVVTRKTYSNATLNTNNGKKPTAANGENVILKGAENLPESTAKSLLLLAKQLETTDSPSKNTSQLQKNLVDCAEQLRQLGLSTIITSQVKSEDRCATDVILAQDSSRSVEKNGQEEHLPGCPALNVDTSHRNWEKGYSFGLSIAALERHVSKFKQNIDIDSDDNLHHMAHVVFHALALIAFQKRGIGTDDRTEFGKRAG